MRRLIGLGVVVYAGCRVGAVAIVASIKLDRPDGHGPDPDGVAT